MCPSGCVPSMEGGISLFQHLAEKSIPLIGKVNAQDISNMVWAYATAGVSHPSLFEKVGNHIVSLDHLRAFKPQALATIVLLFLREW